MTEKYKASGQPLTEFEREIMVILIEEANEVAIAASKLIRFGKDDVYLPEDGKNAGLTNSKVLATEIGHFLALVRVTNRLHLTHWLDVQDGTSNKFSRLRNYVQSEIPDEYTLQEHWD